MRGNDVEISIRDALVIGKGDAKAAVKALAQMAQRDERLLRALVAPYIEGILSHWVQRVMRKLNIDTRVESSKKASAVPQEVSPDVLDQVVAALGDRIPVARPAGASGSPKTAAEAIRSVGIGPDDFPPPKATPKHQNAMRMVAKSFKFNPGSGR